jgi:hypothetical protein
MTLPSFNLLSEFHAETQTQLTKRQEYAARVAEAEALVNALEMRYKEAVTKAVVSGEDNTAELAKINAERAEAKQELENRKHMLSVVRSVQKRNITTADLDREFRKFQAQYQSEAIDGEIEELRRLKVEYLKQYIEIQRRIKNFESVARDVTMTINPNSISVPYSVGYMNQPQIEHACVTQFDLKSLQLGRVPSSVRDEVNK